MPTGALPLLPGTAPRRAEHGVLPVCSAGVDYGDAVSTTVVNVDTTGWVWFDVSTAGMTISNQQAWVIIGTPNNNGYAHATFYSGTATNVNFRPQILFNTTNITSVAISSSGAQQPPMPILL